MAASTRPCGGTWPPAGHAEPSVRARSDAGAGDVVAGAATAAEVGAGGVVVAGDAGQRARCFAGRRRRSTLRGSRGRLRSCRRRCSRRRRAGWWVTDQRRPVDAVVFPCSGAQRCRTVQAHLADFQHVARGRWRRQRRWRRRDQLDEGVIAAFQVDAPRVERAPVDGVVATPLDGRNAGCGGGGEAGPGVGIFEDSSWFHGDEFCRGPVHWHPGVVDWSRSWSLRSDRCRRRRRGVVHTRLPGAQSPPPEAADSHRSGDRRAVSDGL